MHKIVFIFPGQGSQYVGMGKALYHKYNVAKDLFTRADDLLGYSLSRICFEGPEEELKKTDNTQPGIFVVSAIVQTLLREGGIEPEAVAGHSLGEYSALHCSGALGFEDALRIVVERGRAMNDASEKTKGAMTAVIGLELSQAREICKKSSPLGIVQIANINSPTQIVITGDAKAVDAASELATAAGAQRVIPLPVHGAFHSPLMDGATERMREVLKDVKIEFPNIRFINNADAEFLTDPEDIRFSLERQITSCVRWVESVQKLAASGIDLMVEAGPGKVLAGLVRRISRDVVVLSCETPEEIEKTLRMDWETG